jgi:Secretion system C-terminal sorting domain
LLLFYLHAFNHTLKMKIQSPILFLALLMTMGVVQAQTLLSGGIYTNTTWTLANSPYRMNGDVVVFPNVTLTIEPGVVVYVDERPTPMGASLYLEVRGTLNAVGTATQPIRFQATNDSTTVATWQGIRVKDTQGGDATISYITVNNADAPLSFQLPQTTPRLITHSSFNYCGSGHYTWGPVTLRNCTFANNYHGIYGSFNGDTIQVQNCLFSNNLTGIAGLNEVMDVYNCTFVNNSSYAMWGGYLGSKVRKSSFTGNAIGIVTSNFGVIDSCLFAGNGTAVQDAQSAVITYNTFQQNQRALEVGQNTLTQFNEISDNAVGVIISGSLSASSIQPVIVNNRICNNTSYNVENGSDLNYVLDSNCFCLPDSAAIDAKLLDGYDNITRGLVNFSVYDSTCSNILYTVSKVVQVPTSVAEASRGSIQVYPNPSTGLVQVRLSDVDAGADGQVIDLQGRILLRFQMQVGTQQLDLGGLAKGIYQLNLQGRDGERWTQRVVLE